MRRKPTIPKPQLAFCLENTHTITYVAGDSYACIQCGMAFRNEQRDPRLYPTIENLFGRKFERLKVIDFGGYKLRGGKAKAHWECECIEGNTLIVEASNLKQGRTRSCGCLPMELLIERSTIHGKGHTPEFTIWVDMRRRCSTKKDRAYENYGGRGIAVCPQWDASFVAFYQDMGPRPTSQHSLDRIDNNGPYSPENCKWATSAEQNRNKRNNVWITHDGITLSIGDWAAKMNIKPYTLAKRIRDGWTPEKALTEPVRLDKLGNIRRLPTFLTYNGVTQSAKAWAKELNMLPSTLLARLRHGWSTEDALSLPVSLTNKPYMKTRIHSSL